MDLLQTTRYPVNHPILKNLIKYYWVIQSQSPLEIEHKLLPVCNIDFILNLSSPIKYLKDEKMELAPTGFHFNGISDRYCRINQRGILRVFGISFFPTGLFPILKIPVSEFKDKTIELNLIIKDFTESIEDKLNKTHSIPEAITVIENELIKIVDISLMPSKEVYHAFELFNKHINESGINVLCEEYGINQRRLERMFNKYIGMSPKLFYKIKRFQRIVNSLEKTENESFTTLAYNNNYYDQTHFIKDFKSFTGSTPTAFLKQNNSVQQITKYF